MTERRAVFLLYSLAYASGMLALVVRQMRLEVMVTIVAIFVLMLFLIAIYLGGVRVYAEGDAQQPGNTMLRALVGFQYKRRMFEIVLDAVLIALAYHSAYLLRFDGAIPDDQMAIFLRTLPLVIAAQMFFFLIGDIYGGLWRYIGIPDLVAIGRAVILGGAASAFIVFTLFSWRGPSRAVFILNPLLLVCFVGASRLSFRLLRAIIMGGTETHPEARPVLIYGAADGGEMLLREILNNPEHKYAPVGFIDDDQTKVGQWIHGYRIFDYDQLPKLVERHGVSRVLVSSSKVPDSKLVRLRHLGLEFGRLHIRIEVEYVQPDTQEVAPRDAAEVPF
jgi:UDP-GlcNAc:undecaprenyl-phosphate GlcNAc-1-phosphate transferase